MMFKNRHQAGERLAERLKKYESNPDVIIFGLPRGGVVTAFAVANKLHKPLDVICSRKIPAPFNPELAIGAVAQTGEAYINEQLVSYFNVSDDYIEKAVAKEKKVAQKRVEQFRKNLPKIDYENTIAIIVDDGIATGATMHAAIKTLRANGVAKIIVAAPVAPLDILSDITNEVDEVIILHTPDDFQAVGQFYEEFSQTADEEVVALLHKSITASSRK